MKAPALASHLLLKDFRHQRKWLALLWLVALLLPLMARLTIPTDDGKMGAAVMLTADGLLLLTSLVLVRVIRLDPPGWESHFLATRPVPWATLLAGKALFIWLFLLVPFWIEKLGIIWMLKIPVNFMDVVLILTESTIVVGELIAVVALFPLFFRKLPVIVAAIFAWVLFIVFRPVVLQHLPWQANAGLKYGVTLDESRHLIFFLGVIVTIGLVALFRYRRKSPRKPLGILIAGLALSVVAWNYWPCNLGGLFTDKQQNTGELESPLRDQIKFALTGEENHDLRNPVYETWINVRGIPRIREICFLHAVSLEGVKPPYFAVLADYHAEATLKSGRTIRSEDNGANVYMASNEISDGLKQQMLGYTPEFGSKWSAHQFAIFNYLPNPYRNEDLTGANIKGVITLEIRRAFIVKTMPFKPGGEIDIPRRHYTLEYGRGKWGEPVYKLRIASEVPTLRGDYPASSGLDILSGVVFNRSKGEYLNNTGISRNMSADMGALLYVEQLQEVTLGHDTLNGGEKFDQPIAEDWFDNAEISFFSSESCGRISFPYEIKSVDLKH